MGEISEEFKKLARIRFGSFCYVCSREVGWDFNTIIHHKDGSDRHRGNALCHPEYWDECVVMCRMCHRILHTLAERVNENQLSHLLELRKKLCQKQLNGCIEE